MPPSGVAVDAAHMPSFLDHCFPASDIPPQARAAYARNIVRMIPDVEGEAVSPIHLQYLRNMGVGASRSVAIRANDQLWGLVSCHSREARPLEPEGREAAAALTRTAAQRLFALQARKAQQWYEQVRALATSVMEGTARRDDTGDVLQRHGATLCDLFATSGAVLLADERIDA